MLWVNYWAPNHDTCSADCLVEWYTDDDTRKTVWDKFVNAPEPLGYNPTIIPGWGDSPTCVRLRRPGWAPYRLRVMAGTVMMKGQGAPLRWTAK